MKKVVLSLALVAFLGLSLNSCKETKEKTEDTVENAADTVDEAMDDAGQAMDDAADNVKDAADDAADAANEAMDDAEDAVDDAVKAMNEESVTITYTKMVAGKEVKMKKTFEGTSENVEKMVKKFGDSLKALDPNIKIIHN